MKKMWETGLLLFAIWGFWGMIYPDLCFTEDVCVRMVCEETASCEILKEDSDEGNISCSACRQQDKQEAADIYHAKPEQIRIKSRLLEFFKENASEGEERGKGKSNVRDRKNGSFKRSSGGNL